MKRTYTLMVEEIEPRLLLSARPPFIDTIANDVTPTGGTLYESVIASASITTGVPFTQTVEVHDPNNNLRSVNVWYGEETESDDYNITGLTQLPVTINDDGDKYVTLSHTYAFPGIYNATIVIYAKGESYKIKHFYPFNVTVTGKPTVTYDHTIDQYTPIHSGNAFVNIHKHHHRRH